MSIEPRYRRECISKDKKKIRVCLFKTMKNSYSQDSVFESKRSLWSRLTCLGPLTFDHQAVGQEVRLSIGGLLAERRASTFKNGLVFSNRPLRVQEKIYLRVEKETSKWQGGMRVGFTNVPPSARSLPLPPLAIPNLTDGPGHWAETVHESFCRAGSVLVFWVSKGGSIYMARDNRNYRLLKGVDLSKPLWAMIDIYGQTCSIFLMGSEKRGLCTRQSCPVSKHHLILPDVDNHLIPGGKSNDGVSRFDMEVPADKDDVMDCVACKVEQARVTLPCGHRCLCSHCCHIIVQMFGKCPLCRHTFTEGGMIL